MITRWSYQKLRNTKRTQFAQFTRFIFGISQVVVSVLNTVTPLVLIVVRVNVVTVVVVQIVHVNRVLNVLRWLRFHTILFHGGWNDDAVSLSVLARSLNLPPVENNFELIFTKKLIIHDFSIDTKNFNARTIQTISNYFTKGSYNKVCHLKKILKLIQITHYFIFYGSRQIWHLMDDTSNNHLISQSPT